MKILKPGKVEMRKFVCEKCGCEFVTDEAEHTMFLTADSTECPTCYRQIAWKDGEPYEEPTPTPTDRARLTNLVNKYFDVFDGYCDGLINYLLRNGVTFWEG